MILHCLTDCLHDRADEKAGPIVACDGCDRWFHTKCIHHRKSFTGPNEANGWFCPDCK